MVFTKWFYNLYCGHGFQLCWSWKYEVERQDQKKGSFVKIEHPEVVLGYNLAMGGVDKLDQLISLYRRDIRSRKWTLRT